MSGTEMGSREQFSLGMHSLQHQHQHQHQHQPQLHQNMRLDYAADGTAVYAASTVNMNGGESSAAAVPQGLGLGQGQGQVQVPAMMGGSSETLKRKRGRPRKYGPDGTMSLSLTTTPPPASSAAVPVSHSGGQFPPASASDSASPGSLKRRGRPRGSLNKNPSKSSYGSGATFTPHVITVKAGEDLSSRIMALSENDSRHVCILTANGAISNVTLRQPSTTGGTVTYEGRFEILSLGGSLFIAENGGQCSRVGGLSVSLSGPDGRVLGGGVAGLLIAASPVQVVLASFVSDGRKASKSAKRMGNVSAPPKASTAGQSSSPSRGTVSESSGGPGSPLNQSTGACNNNNPAQGFSGMPWK
ncbi:AT-hook motif nuclear-localized protein 10 [Abrus precatorius]|uniref:AT-hook motif nuclear-localized protein n=1 Tax=Abrus precatorius TaxID=3816 RepID=A0A8B8LKC5_ABRPR|nr:AT-hook motif nuclear-localized protein 10 [Abrus precatorius]